MARVLIYVAGSAHSGSTLLDLMLGQHPRCVSAGQLGDIDRFLGPDDVIDVERLRGEKLDFWEKVLEGLSPQQRRSLQRMSPTIRKERLLLRFLLSRRFRGSYARAYDDLLAHLFAGAPDCEAVIDSTKNVSRAVALTASIHEIRVVHLIRSGRGYLNSKAKRLGDLRNQEIVHFTLKWAVKNLLASAILKPLFGRRYLLVRYEDLMAEPLTVVERILSSAGVASSPAFAMVIQSGKFSRRAMVHGNRISKEETVVFDPGQASRSIVGTKSRLLYFLSGGFLERFWGY